MKSIGLLAVCCSLAWGLKAQTKVDSLTRKRLEVYPVEIIYPIANENSRRLLIFPNPAKDWIEINLFVPDKDGFTLDLFNEDGNSILHTLWQEGDKIDLSNFKEGIYVLMLQKGRIIFRRKLIVNK